MQKEILKEQLKAELEGMIPEGTTVVFNTVTKPNNITLLGVSLKREDSDVCPTIYIDSALEDIEKGVLTVHDLAATIIETDEEHRFDELSELVHNMTKEFILDTVVYKVLNKELNCSLLETIPHKELLDLALVYSVELICNKDLIGSIRISNELMKLHNISLEELDEAARNNTFANGFTIIPMDELLAEMCEELKLEEAIEEMPNMLYVLTNKKRHHGATILAFEDALNRLANRLDDDLFILPSSVHETLAISCSASDLEHLKAMVKDVNETAVSPDDLLSYSVYRFSRSNGKLAIA